MDEDVVAAKVAQNIPKDEAIQDVPETTVEEAPKLSAFEANVELNDPAIGLRVADYLGLSKTDRFTEERQSQLRSIYRWAAERAGSVEVGAVLDQLMVLENELGSFYSSNRIDKLAQWVSLHRQSEALRRQMEYVSGQS